MIVPVIPGRGMARESGFRRVIRWMLDGVFYTTIFAVYHGSYHADSGDEGDITAALYYRREGLGLVICFVKQTMFKKKNLCLLARA